MTPVLRAYLLAMAAPAVVLTAMLLVGPSAAPGDPVLLVVLLLLGAVASNFPVIVSPRLKTDAAPAVYLAAVLLFTPVTAVALIGGSRLLGEGVLCGRRDLRHVCGQHRPRRHRRRYAQPAPSVGDLGRDRRRGFEAHGRPLRRRLPAGDTLERAAVAGGGDDGSDRGHPARAHTIDAAHGADHRRGRVHGRCCRSPRPLHVPAFPERGRPRRAHRAPAAAAR